MPRPDPKPPPAVPWWLTAFCRAEGLPEPIPEFRFCPPRRWAFDFAWRSHMNHARLRCVSVALEIEGGLFGKGRRCPACGRRPVAGHSSIERLTSDLEKYNRAAILGWTVLRVTPRQVEKGEAAALLREALGAHRGTV